MANLKKMLLSEAGDEPIEAIVVGQHDNVRYSALAAADENVLIPIDAALAKLDVEYNNSYGGADCFPFIAWTATKVIFVAEYDGATGLAWVPRNPIAIEPSFSGQS